MCIDVASLSCSADQGNNKAMVLENAQIFPKGEKIESENFHGAAWLQWLSVDDSINHIGVGSVTFEPGARTNWHKHPGGQILLVTEGKGYYQEKGMPAQLIKNSFSFSFLKSILKKK